MSAVDEGLVAEYLDDATIVLTQTNEDLEYAVVHLADAYDGLVRLEAYNHAVGNDEDALACFEQQEGVKAALQALVDAFYDDF